MPSRPVPPAFWLLLVFGLLLAGVISMAGFAIHKADLPNESAARDASNAAAAELIASGLFTADENDPALALLAQEGQQEQQQEAEEPEEEQSGDGEADSANGQELFFANGCNVCHGDNGQGGIGPTLASTNFTLDQVISRYRSPRGVMPIFSEDRVPDTNVADIYAWLQTLPLPNTIVPGLGTP